MTQPTIEDLARQAAAGDLAASEILVVFVVIPLKVLPRVDS